MASTMASPLSLYIPRVHNKCHNDKKKGSTLMEYMTQVFHDMELGAVSHIDFVPINGKGSDFSKAFVHFNNWYETSAAIDMQEAVVKPDVDETSAVRIVYDNPHYWILKPNKSRTHDNTKISSLEKQIASLTMKLQTYSEILDNKSLANNSFKEPDNEGMPSKRKR